MTGGTSGGADGRVHFGDVRPYAVVDRLDQLAGPVGGVIELPHSVLWAPDGGRVDLDRPGELRMAYRRADLTKTQASERLRTPEHPGRASRDSGIGGGVTVLASWATPATLHAHATRIAIGERRRSRQDQALSLQRPSR